MPRNDDHVRIAGGVAGSQSVAYVLRPALPCPLGVYRDGAPIVHLEQEVVYLVWPRQDLGSSVERAGKNGLDPIFLFHTLFQCNSGK